MLLEKCQRLQLPELQAPWFFFTCIFFSVAMRPRCWKGAAWPLIALRDGWGWVVVVGSGSEEGGGGRTVCMSSEQGFLHGNTWVSVFDSWNVFWYNPPPQPPPGWGWGWVWVGVTLQNLFLFFTYLTVIVWQIKDQSSNLVDDGDCGVFFFFFFNTFGRPFLIGSRPKSNGGPCGRARILLSTQLSAAAGSMNQTLSRRWTPPERGPSWEICGEGAEGERLKKKKINK